MINVNKLMLSLSKKRPVFHSEADFQHALAWEIHQNNDEFDVRLEYPAFDREKKINLDIWLKGKNGEDVALELKYKKKEFCDEVNGEHFEFTSDAARDGGCFGFLEDIRRVESLRKDIKYGASILLTNENLYWKEGSDRGKYFEEFSLNQGRKIPNKMEWFNKTSDGYKSGRADEIKLDGSYTVNWKTYSPETKAKNSHFKWLMFDTL